MKRAFYFILAVVLALPAYVFSQDPEDLPMDPPSGYYDVVGNPAGEVDNITYGSNYPARVYTPPDYDPQNKYASMYLMHGMGGSEASWHDNDLYAHRQLDNLIADGRVDGFVIVFTKNQLPNPIGWEFEDPLLNELIPYIEQNYSVSEDGAHRALGGLSMGGMQTINMGFPNADKFHYLMPCSSPFFNKEEQVFPDGGELARNNLELVLFTEGSQEGGLHRNIKSWCENAGLGDIMYEYIAPNAGHSRDTWRPSFWNFAQMAFDRGFTDISGGEIAPVSSKANTLNFSLNQNPYSKTIKISFTLPQTTMINVTIFNIDGTMVRTLASGEKVGGQYILNWDGKDNYGKHLSTGVYMLRLTTGGDALHKKIMLIR